MINSIYSKNISSSAKILDYAIIYENVVIGDNVVIGEHNVIGKLPTPTSNICRNLDLNLTKTVIGESSRLCSHVTVYSNVVIGDNCLLGDNVSIFTDVKIGKNVIISRNVTVNSETEIGKRGNSVFISTGVFMANDNFFGKFGYNEECMGPTLGDNVSIGVGVILLPNVTIGRGSIIAAGSVVKNDIPDCVLAAGNPAKVITKLPNNWGNI